MLAQLLFTKRMFDSFGCYVRKRRKNGDYMKEVYNNLTVCIDEATAYPIHLQEGYDALPVLLEQFSLKNRRICIVSDSTVASYYLDTMLTALKEVGYAVYSYVFQAGEEHKNLTTVEGLYEYLIQQEFDRNDVLLALGGGVTGDLTGYAAATYLRGIRFIGLPTSLLSMVDSSIGGKTGVDFKQYKNMVGAFHQPKAVYMNMKTLETLNERQFVSGMGEILKHGLIKDALYFEWIKQNKEAILARDMDILRELVYRSLLVKKEVVEHDPKEQGERALLNFGHTIGHAVEKLKNFELLHGECVAIGMVAATYLSCLRGYITKEELAEITETIRAFGLPVAVSGIKAEDIVSACRHDKKMDGKHIKFILLKQVGEAIIDTSITQEELLMSAEYILKVD